MKVLAGKKISQSKLFTHKPVALQCRTPSLDDSPLLSISASHLLSSKQREHRYKWVLYQSLSLPHITISSLTGQLHLSLYC